MKPKVGQTLVSTVDATTVIVIKATDVDVEITCGGAVMVDPKGDQAGTQGTADPSQQAGAQLGKRYSADVVGLELLCTRGGTGTLAADGTPLPLKGAKPLPASD